MLDCRDAPTATVGLHSAAERSTLAKLNDGLSSDSFRDEEATATPASGQERAPTALARDDASLSLSR
jgi:hypothetical protein